MSFPHSILVGLFSVSSLMSCVTTSSRPFSGLRLGGSPAHWDALRVFPLALARTNARTHLNMQSPHQEDDVILGTRIFLLTYSSALHYVIFPACRNSLWPLRGLFLEESDAPMCPKNSKISFSSFSFPPGEIQIAKLPMHFHLSHRALRCVAFKENT